MGRKDEEKIEEVMQYRMRGRGYNRSVLCSGSLSYPLLCKKWETPPKLALTDSVRLQFSRTMASLAVLHHQTQPSFSLLTSSFSDFNGTRVVHSHLQVPLLPNFVYLSVSLWLLVIKAAQVSFLFWSSTSRHSLNSYHRLNSMMWLVIRLADC